MLNIKQIASEEGLPVDSVPLPDVGEGGVYFTTTYNITAIVIALALIFAYAICVALIARSSHK